MNGEAPPNRSQACPAPKWMRWTGGGEVGSRKPHSNVVPNMSWKSSIRAGPKS